jgi:hypothetical protein
VPTATLWIIGLFVSLIVGQFAAGVLTVKLRQYLHKKPQFKIRPIGDEWRLYAGIDFYPPLKESERSVPIWLTGPMERLFFTLIVAFQLSGAAIAMVAWITIKMFTSDTKRKERHAEDAFPFQFTGLLGNLTSMLFALVGGLICR